jgi:transcriptional regulator CtsR
MANISDIIEQFILQSMGQDNSLHLSRNDLAVHFSCAPSQINYVLTTRFTPSRGFLIESRRGGGGYVRIVRLDVQSNNLVNSIINNVGDQIGFKDASYVLSLLTDAGIISQKQCQSALVLMSDKALANPFKLEDKIRANMLKTLIYNSIKGDKV